MPILQRSRAHCGSTHSKGECAGLVVMTHERQTVCCIGTQQILVKSQLTSSCCGYHMITHLRPSSVMHRMQAAHIHMWKRWAIASVQLATSSYYPGR
jgi:hypothetical protein